MKLARTIADLAGSEEIQSAHLAEALHAHLHCNTPVLADDARERGAAQVSQSSEDHDG